MVKKMEQLKFIKKYKLRALNGNGDIYENTYFDAHLKKIFAANYNNTKIDTHPIFYFIHCILC